MFNKKNFVVVTNNDHAYARFEKEAEEIIYLENYIDVLKKSRDLIYSGYKLLATPQASGLKPNQTPYRTILLEISSGKAESRSVQLIEKAIESFGKWQEIRKTPTYSKEVDEDFKTIDISMIDNVV